MPVVKKVYINPIKSTSASITQIPERNPCPDEPRTRNERADRKETSHTSRTRVLYLPTTPADRGSALPIRHAHGDLSGIRLRSPDEIHRRAHDGNMPKAEVRQLRWDDMPQNGTSSRGEIYTLSQKSSKIPSSAHFRAHCRKQQHITDRRGVGEKHYQTVDTDTDTPSWGHTILQSPDVIGVVIHRLIIT